MACCSLKHMRLSSLGGLLFAACSAPMVAPAAIDAGVVVDAGPVEDAGVEPDGGLAEPDAGLVTLAPSTPWGATIDDARQELVFRVFSSRATRIEVSLYRHALQSVPFVKQVLDAEADGGWSTRVPFSALGASSLDEPVFYGYRAWGPNWPFVETFAPGSSEGFRAEVDGEGNRFNPNKLLIDPFALELTHDPKTPGSIDFSPYLGGATNRVKDSGLVVPKGVVMRRERVDLGVRPLRALKDDVIYEVHVRGLTMNDTSLPEAVRGTYAGAGLRARALAELGVTAIEFLPVQETQNDLNDLDPTSVDGDNYWGYATLAYFAPDRRYSSDKRPGGPTREFQQMVRAFHEAGLKVFIDVVYNHTGESGTMTFRGLDNPTYYSLTNDRQRSVDNNGVSGNFNTRNRAAQTVIIDSLKYWHEVLGVDGYRFDLSSVLGNTCEHGCFQYSRDDRNTALNQIMQRLPVRSFSGGPGVDLIAEPWAIGAGTYQVGNHPSGWAEWNDRFRDAVRSHQNRLGFNETTLDELAKRLGGSVDLFGDDGRPPGASINFVVAHDGFTLRDLYSCNAKNNGQAWPWGPSNGGSDSNRSWDHGGSAAAQRQAARKGMALTLLAAGTPMFNGGDEHLRTLRCNNNPYNLDSEKNWLASTLANDEQTFRTFTQRLLSFRAAHPALRPARALRFTDGNGNGVEQLKWFTPTGQAADAAYLQNPANHAASFRLDGTELGEQDLVLVMINGWTDELTFTLPSGGAGRTWRLAGDTCAASEGPEQVVIPGAERPVMGTSVRLCGRGLALLVAR